MNKSEEPNALAREQYAERVIAQHRDQLTSDPCEARQHIEYELESLRVDSAQLGRYADAITKAMPEFRCAMGSQCDHAEVALRELIEQRDALHKALDDLCASVLNDDRVDQGAIDAAVAIIGRVNESKGIKTTTTT